MQTILLVAKAKDFGVILDSSYFFFKHISSLFKNSFSPTYKYIQNMITSHHLQYPITAHPDYCNYLYIGLPNSGVQLEWNYTFRIATCFYVLQKYSDSEVFWKKQIV